MTMLYSFFHELKRENLKRENLDVTEDEIRLMAEVATEGIERATAQ
jgi:hypothetical protein